MIGGEKNARETHIDSAPHTELLFGSFLRGNALATLGNYAVDTFCPFHVDGL